MSTTPIQTDVRVPPYPDGSPASWVYLADLVLPPEKQRAYEERCRRWRFGRVHRQSVEWEMKLSHFFSGLDVAYKITPRGLLVLMAGDWNSSAFCQFLDAMPRVDRCQVAVWQVPRPEDMDNGAE